MKTPQKVSKYSSKIKKKKQCLQFRNGDQNLLQILKHSLEDFHNSDCFYMYSRKKVSKYTVEIHFLKNLSVTNVATNCQTFPLGCFMIRRFCFAERSFQTCHPIAVIRLQKVSKSSDNFLKNSVCDLKMLIKCSFKFSNNPMNILIINWFCFFLPKKKVPHASPSCLKN